MKKIYTFLLFLFPCLLLAQKEANIWYFGNGAGLDFTSGYPKPLLNGQLYTNEGCAVTCDSKGKLLFYTDGVTVFDRNHDTMPNGRNLAGGHSSTQSAIIVQKPGTNNIYYLFTVAEQAESAGLSYSIVDMNLNKNRGGVIEKNKMLLTPTAEKLTAVNHSNGKAVWIITHEWGTNSFYCYMLSSLGLSSPVISKIGIVHKDYGSGDKSEAIGYLKVSPNGKKIACVIDKLSSNNIEIFDFNNTTGIISNPMSISAKGNAYGASFSPDNSKLYVSFEVGSNGVVQYDMNAPNIAASAVTVSSNNNSRHGALQTGPDKKIYIATAKPYLDVIVNPNAKGSACQYQVSAVDLMTRYSAFGLPSFCENYFNSSALNLGNDTTVCASRFVLDAKMKADKYQWSTGATISKIIVENTGKYWLNVTEGAVVNTDTINITINKKSQLKVRLGNDTSVCDKQIILDAKNPASSYRWSTGETTQKITIDKSSQYWVRVNDGACVKADTIDLKFKGEPVFLPLKEFTPNNGGFNEIFDYVIDNIDEFELKIFKRGKLVFESTDPNVKWRGEYKNKTAPEGNYSWTLNYRPSCMSKQKLVKKGEVKLIRFSSR